MGEIMKFKVVFDCSEEDLEKKGKRGRKYIVENFSSDIVAKKMIEVYLNIIGHTKRN